MIRRHLLFGWWSLLFFVGLGIALESMHGLKIRWYLDVTNETRRLLFTLAHAHGTLLALINLVFALALRALPGDAGVALASPCLIAGSVLLPVGFLLGGVFIYGGDPGLGVLLTPPGALLLLVALFLTARAFAATPAPPEGSAGA